MLRHGRRDKGLYRKRPARLTHDVEEEADRTIAASHAKRRFQLATFTLRCSLLLMHNNYDYDDGGKGSSILTNQ